MQRSPIPKMWCLSNGCAVFGMLASLGNPLLVQWFWGFPNQPCLMTSLQPPPSFTSVAQLTEFDVSSIDNPSSDLKGLFGFIWFYSQLGHGTQAKKPPVSTVGTTVCCFYFWDARIYRQKSNWFFFYNAMFTACMQSQIRQDEGPS